MILLEIANAIEAIPEHYHPIWNNVFFYLFIAAIILFASVIFIIKDVFEMNKKELKLSREQHAAKIDKIRGEQSNTLENLRIEMLKREEERTRQWIESEKETLHVLNGVSNLLDLTDKIGRVESEKIIAKLEEIHKKVEDLS